MRRLIHGFKAEAWKQRPALVSTRNVKMPEPSKFALLWAEAATGAPLTAEHRFHASRRWRFDFACIPAKVAIEIEGGTWAGKPCKVCGQRSGGRHNRGAGFANDCEKYREAAYLGWLVFRFPSEQVTPENVRRLAEFCIDRINPAISGGRIDQ